MGGLSEHLPGEYIGHSVIPLRKGKLLSPRYVIAPINVLLTQEARYRRLNPLSQL